MSLDSPDVIDFLGLSKDRSNIVIAIIDAMDWSDPTHHIQLLKTKVERYIECVQAGHVHRMVAEKADPTATTRPVRLDVHLRYQPPPQVHQALSRIQTAALMFGITMTIEVT